MLYHTHIVEQCLHAGWVAVYKEQLIKFGELMVYLARWSIFTVKLQAYHTREFLGQGIAYHRDNTHRAACYHGEGEGVVAAYHLEVVGLVLDNLVHLFQRTTGLFHGNDVRTVFSQPHRGGRLHVYAGASGHIIHHQRQRSLFCNGFKVLIKTFLRGLVIVRADRQNTVYTAPGRALHVLYHGHGVVASAVFQNGHPAFIHPFHHLRDLVLLLSRQARSLARSGKDAQEVCAIANLKVHQPL